MTISNFAQALATFVLNIYFKAQLNIFIETARYKFQFIIIIIITVIAIVCSPLAYNKILVFPELEAFTELVTW